ncbi:hypothetical protein [Photobacterium rosenbergii]|uniref:hypothetical protein n=1 Tax=Photobacterium rosenbergii TaxID=294936 RepID=UPI001C99AE23|nr:hypothetical protein [Photobacterium rosenbergii]MBY5947895.1 hypothetical protein [Photobacterium rosenbergii]
MCKQTSYSKYQKRAIKFLTDLLGTETPFTYERTQSNHLKILIDGVERPIYTGSTPSDCKSINNFMAEVKREIRLSKDDHCDAEQAVKSILPDFIKHSHDKLISGCVKSLRARLEVMKSQEEEKVLESKELSVINSFRTNVIKHAISLALQARKQGSYIKPKEMKDIEASIGKHLNFMMPTMAYYSELLDSKSKYKNIEALPSVKPGEAMEISTVKQEVEAAQERVVPIANGTTVQVSNKSDTSAANDITNSASELMAMSANNRISLLRNLTKSQALLLIDDINQAMALNREQDIEAVVAMIRDKELPLEAIISRMEAA